ncbi:OTOG [Cervus elaphus hippelaphus]|uniref:OTOG n=1 Tax=Cervus elaphus hippelaphus TaxID=46360 RepID=A0A212DHS1_CEREH|nr:OTOG [Cervus elaphus hippelaphus]
MLRVGRGMPCEGSLCFSVCQRGSFQCTLHPCASTCTAYGDRHYRTFDGLPFDFVGACKVHLVKSTSDFSFSVIVEKVNCYSSGIICRKFISINVGNSLIIFDDDSGNPVRPGAALGKGPYQLASLVAGGALVAVKVAGGALVLVKAEDVAPGDIVNFLLTAALYKAKAHAYDCDFFNKGQEIIQGHEHMRPASRELLQESFHHIRQWCPDTLDPRDTCVLNPLREPFAKKECSVLLSEVFETCHPVVDVTWFYSNCLTDTCGCSRGGDCECFCASVSAYAHQCCQHGVAIDWRTPRLCHGAWVSAPPTWIPLCRLYPPWLFADPDVVSLEAADRPNFFLHVTANGSLELAKWQAGDAFRHRASFSLHLGTWRAGLVALESLAEPGAFLYVSGPVLALRLYQHTEAFRRGTLFRLLDAKPSGAAYPTCEWHYDACASPCFQTCRDPRAAGCRDVPRVEGCVPACATPKVLDEVTQRCVHLEDCVEPVVLVPTEALGNETLPPGQALPTPSDRELQFPQEAPGASSHRPALTPTALLTTALNPPTAASAGPVLSPGTAQATQQQLLGVTASSLPEHPTEARASKGVTAGHPASPGAPEPSSLPLSQHVTTSGMGSGAMETTRVTVILAESPNITVSSLSPPAPGFPLVTKAVTVLGLGSLPVKTTPLQPFPSLELPASPSSRPVASPAVTSMPPTSSGVREASLTSAMTKVMTGTGVPQSIQAQGPSSPSSPPVEARTAAEQIPAHPLVTESMETVPPPEKVQPGPSQPTGLPAAPLPSPFPMAPARPAQHATTAARPPAWPSGTAAAASLSTVAQGLRATPFTTLESTRPAQLLSGLPPDTSLPLAKVGTSAPVATPGPKGSTLTPPLQQQATSIAVATTLPAGTLGPAPPLTPAVLAQVHPPSHAVPQATGTAPGLLVGATLPTPGVVAVAEGAASTVSAAPRKSTTEKTAILSKQVSLPTRVSGSTQRGPTELMPAVAHAAATLVTGAEGLWAGTPIAEQDCVRHICLQGELIRVNQSQHCPQSAAAPRCGVLGLAVRVGGDLCCPVWECACESWGLLAPPVSPSCPYPSLTAAPRLRALGSRGRCSIFPDLSFVTFDGSHVALFKEAIYILSQRPEEMVTVHVLDCKSANLGHLNWPPFCLVMLNVTHKTHEVTIDRFNRKVSASGSRPTGVCDGHAANDLTLKDGSVVGEAEDPAPFLDSWQVPSSLTSVGQTRFRPDSCATADCSPCLRMVSNRTFSACHRFVSPESFCDLWIRDTKYVQQPCVALTVYVAMCHKFHVCIEWRRSDYCRELSGRGEGREAAKAGHPGVSSMPSVALTPHPSFLCSSDSTYQACVSACEPPRTCQDGLLGPLDPAQCQVLGEGCVCSEGTILHRRHSGLCIPEEKCGKSLPSPGRGSLPWSLFPREGLAWDGLGLPTLLSPWHLAMPTAACTDSTGVPRALGETWNSSLSGCCQHQCQAPDTIVPVDRVCPGPRPESCPRFGEVALLQPTEDPCCLGTVCGDRPCGPRAACNQTLCEGLAPTCSPGHRLLTHFQEDSCCPRYSCECDPDLCEAVQVPSCRQDQILIAGRLGDLCCISYFCACGDCPDPIPECQEGEALTVDRNTTELCCPLYQCVCESFRCPHVQCGMGTALVEVWSPERCCPYKSCECDCDTIPVPRCHLWEKSQLDEAFMRSAENVCGCAKYECGEWGGRSRGGRARWVIPGWASQPGAGRGAGLLLTVTTLLAHPVKAPVCLSRELGVMQPGQTVVELSADGVCHTSRCTDVLDPLTSFYQINTTSVLCDVHCEANQEYEHPRDLAACCGSCRNVSCLFTFPNGTTSLFLPGASWIAHCTRHHCSSTPLGAVLVRSPISCPPLNETECAKVSASRLSRQHSWKPGVPAVLVVVVGKEDGRSCKKVTIRMTIRKNECRSNTPVLSCDGRCPSASIYNYNINTYARFCKCCREVGLQRRSLQLFCATNATWVPYTLQEPTDCACQWS